MSDSAATREEHFEARYSPLRVAPYLLGSLTFVALGWLLFARVAELPARIGGFAVILVFGAFCVLFASKLFDRRVQVRIDGRGLVCLAHSDRPIALRSIKQVADRGAWLALYLYKPQKYPPTQPVRRMLMAVNNWLSQGAVGDVFVQIRLLDCSSADLFAALARHRPMTDFERDLERRAKIGRG